MISSSYYIAVKSVCGIITYAIVVILLMSSNCSSQGVLPSNSEKLNQHQRIEKTSPTNSNGFNAAEDLLISKAKAAIQKYKLTELSLECLLFEISDFPRERVSFVTVRELHNVQCGGDPMTSPRLFTLRIKTNNGEVWTDAKSLAGEFERLE